MSNAAQRVLEDDRGLLSEEATSQRRRVLALAEQAYGAKGIESAIVRYLGRSDHPTADRWAAITVDELDLLEESLAERVALMAEPGHLLLVDGHNLLYRSFYAVRARKAVAAFLTKVDQAIGGTMATHVAVIFDSGADGGRRALWPRYKTDRPDVPPELRALVPAARIEVAAHHPTLDSGQVEADDLIAAYVQVASARGWGATIFTTDKDLQQLVCPWVGIWDSKARTRIGVAEITARWGVPPQQLGDLLALMGDSADKVPGVPGIGPVLAARLLAKHGDLEAVIAAAARETSKKAAAIVQYADQARLCRTLVRLQSEVALPVPLEALRRTTRRRCRARGCDQACPRGHLMCSSCWRLVPTHIQRSIGAASQAAERGQPSRAWSRAVDQAIDAVLRAQTQALDRRRRG